jgi:hypothetical protein
MNAMQTAKYVENIGHTARELEQLARRVGFYAKDADMLDAAIKKGKSGVTILFDENGGEPEIYTLGAPTHKVTVEKGGNPDEWTVNYEPLDERGLARRVASGKCVRERHENPSPVNISHKPTQAQLTGDALKAKQTADAKKERDIRAEGIARSESIFAAMKAASHAQWGRKC